ncbi:hypothetical protein [Kiloniella antarctica]|uniref:Uncharacterized protein n=1 Tax=Kiloniella antarctica TaxID=1550907 RepID=A0ABW5BKK7_9PROT
MKPNLVERFFLDECTTEIKLLLEIQIDEMISGKGPKVHEHSFNLYDLRLDAIRKKVRIIDIFDPQDSGRLEVEMFHFRAQLKRLLNKPGTHTRPQKNKRSSRVLDFIAASAKKLSSKKRTFVDASELLLQNSSSKGDSIKSKILKTKSEKYIKLLTDPALPKRMRSLGLMDTGDKATLLLEENLPPKFDQSYGQEDQSTDLLPARYSVIFHKHLCYRRTDEGNRLRMLTTMDPATLVSSGYGLFEVQYSEFFKWFDKESYNRYERRAPFHYCCITTHEVYDILCYQAPEIVAMPSSDLVLESISLWDLF